MSRSRGRSVLLQVSQGEDREAVKAHMGLVGDLDKQFEWSGSRVERPEEGGGHSRPGCVAGGLPREIGTSPSSSTISVCWPPCVVLGFG